MEVEPNEFRVVVLRLADDGRYVGRETHDRMVVVAEAREMMLVYENDTVKVQARAVTPWREIDIPYPPEVER